MTFRHAAWGPTAAGRTSGATTEPAGYGILAVALPLTGVILLGIELDLPQLTTLGAVATLMTGLLFPAAGLATLAIMAPFEPPTVLSPVGLNALLIVAIIVGSIARLPSEKPQLTLGGVVFPLGAFVLFVAVQQIPDLSSGWSGPQGQFVAAQFKQLLTGFGAAIAGALVLWRRNPYPFLLAAVASAAIAAALTLLTPDGRILGSSLSGILSPSIGGGRAAGPFGNANYYGLFQATAVAAAAGWIAIARSRSARLILLAVCGVLVAAVVLSYSRGALVAMVAGLAMLAFARSRAIGIAVTVTAMALVFVVYPAFAELRLGFTYGTLSTEAYLAAQRSDAERLSAIAAGWDLFLAEPVFGVGFGRYHFLSAPIVGDQAATFSHNWYINVLAEQGVVGAVLWIGLLVAVAAKLRSRSGAARTVGIPVFGAFLVGSLFTEPPTSFETSSLVLIVVVAAMVGNWSTPALQGVRPDPATAADDPFSERGGSFATHGSSGR